MARGARMKFAAIVLAAAVGLSAQTPAEDFIEAGHWKRARALVEARLREAPDDPLALFLMSQIHFAFGQKDAPLKLAERAVNLAPDVAKFHRQLAEAMGVMAQRSNMLQQAFLARKFKKEIDTAIALDRKNVQSQRDLMEYYLLAPGLIGGDKKQAREVALGIARIDAAEGFLVEARLAAFERDRGRQEAMLRKAVEAEPARYKARIALAQFYTKEKVNWEAAAEQAHEAVKIDPARVDGYSILATAYAARGQWPELEAILNGAARQVPDDWTSFFRAAEATIATGKNFATATVYLRKYLTQEPEGNAPTHAEARELLKQIAAHREDRPVGL